MKFIKRLSHIVLITLIIPAIAWAQSTDYMVDESSTMIVTGTSTVHDWEADVNKMDLTVSFNPDMLSQDTVKNPVTSLMLKVPVETIDSGKGGMDKRIDKALKHKDHPNIIFTLLSAELANEAMSDTVDVSNSFVLNIKGNLNVAGTEKEVSFPVKGTKTGENNYRFEGEYGLNMTDYNVEPPSAMFGAIKAGEEIEIKFDIVLTTKQI